MPWHKLGDLKIPHRLATETNTQSGYDLIEDQINFENGLLLKPV